MATLNDRSHNRIQYHLSQADRRQGLLKKYAPGSKGYERTLKALKRDEAVVEEVRMRMVSRLDKAAEAVEPTEPKTYGGRGPKGPTGPRAHRRFEALLGVDLTVSNDVDVDDMGNVISKAS